MARQKQRPMMLYIEAELYEKIKKRGSENSPPVKPGPMAAEILRQHFNTQKGEKSNAAD